ncbi:uncharacterized protein MYCFIDRAFT_170950 [Pseudocercospora fijiensis CIRAD86]|uniref:Uncharacterized protein n=1 Tax=Pseudocercospora fijiensis (strain CIRAD86) TaxID=383855 RepID=N1QCZ5_PSEFD|nr:uncharacterized protein MYCFIDRAFT_170950 [Pseudocercospora fijiensis CIRAD86]EME89493.1 hypothetical protein MYCFIDRAFT_170950 [Pseudocercospora fijiensis CIRAD86]
MDGSLVKPQHHIRHLPAPDPGYLVDLNVYGRSEKHMPQDSTHPLVHMQGTLGYYS